MLLAHGAATWAMTGLIWFVQVVHYPLMRGVGVAGFAAYHEAHSRLTTLVVAPLMLVEASTAIWLAVVRPVSVPAAWIGVGLLAIVWGVTFFVSVPRHTQLGLGFDAAVVDSLVVTNWIRTLGWTARAFVASWMIYSLVRTA